MADPRELRNKRLTNEYKELMRINGSVIQIEPLGTVPFDRYRVTFNIRTIVSAAPTYREKTVCTLIIPPSYPSPTGAPKIVANDKPYPFHINWFSNGQWCSAYYSANYDANEPLVNFINRCARTLQFDPLIANPSSVANHLALPFWNANKNNRRVFPCDTQVLPTLDSLETITIKNRPAPQIIFAPRIDKPKITILPK